MHRAGTDRNITPTTQQMPGNSPSERAAGGSVAVTAGNLLPVEIDDTEFIEPGFAARTSTVEISNSANGIGARWDTFQNRLRERRKEVIGSGGTEESADRYRKAS